MSSHDQLDVLVRPPTTSMRLRDFFELQKSRASSSTRTRASAVDSGPHNDKGLDHTTFYLEYLALHQYLGEPFLEVFHPQLKPPLYNTLSSISYT